MDIWFGYPFRILPCGYLRENDGLVLENELTTYGNIKLEANFMIERGWILFICDVFWFYLQILLLFY